MQCLLGGAARGGVVMLRGRDLGEREAGAGAGAGAVRRTVQGRACSRQLLGRTLLAWQADDREGRLGEAGIQVERPAE